MTSFGVSFRQFEREPQRDQLKQTFNNSIELIFKTMETYDIDINTSQSTIDLIVNRNCGNKFHHQNGTNQRQHNNKNFSQ